VREAAREGFQVLSKPYDIQALDQFIREVLGAADTAI
jgi:hypothetical protein